MIGLINFIHSDPLFKAFKEKQLVKRDTPKGILKSLLSGELECGMISLLEFFEHADVLELKPSATIHSLKGTMSTLLVSRGKPPINGMDIAITEHTRTTAMYLKLVLERMGLEHTLHWSSKTEAVELLEEADYALVIGNEALRVFGTKLKIIWDIGYQFSALFSLMPVFAVTVSRKGKSCEEELSGLGEAIADSRNFIDESAQEDSAKFSLPIELLRRYFRTIRYEFNSEVERTVDYMSKVEPISPV